MTKEKSNIIFYQSEDGKTKIETRLEDENVWLNQAQLGELFQKSKSTISEHISNIFKEGELEENSVVRNFRTTASDGKNYDTLFYNLDVIIISHQQALNKAEKEYEKYKERIKNELSEVEKHFIKQIESTAKKVGKKQSSKSVGAKKSNSGK